MDLDTIILGEGIGDITFGMKKQAIIAILGSGFEESTDEEGDIELNYPELHIHCTLWKDRKYTLGVISTERSGAVLQGKKIMGRNKADIRQFLTETLESGSIEAESWTHENGTLQECLDADELNLSFWFLNDALYLVDYFRE